MNTHTSISRLTSLSISIAWYLSLISLAIIAFGMMAIPFLPLGDSTDLKESIPMIFAYGLQIAYSLEGVDWGQYRQSMFLVNLVGLISMGITVYGLYHLRWLYKQIYNQQPFISDSVSRMQKVGLTLLVGTILATLQAIFAGPPVMLGGREVVEATITAGSPLMTFISGFELYAIFYCIILLGFADVFRVGLELQQEVEHTV